MQHISYVLAQNAPGNTAGAYTGCVMICTGCCVAVECDSPRSKDQSKVI